LYDTAGKAYLDFANGIAVTALGHAHPRVTAAIHAQVDKLMGPINAIGFTEPISRLADAIAATMPDPLDSVMFLNSGSEAIDAALKLARRTTGRPGIVAFRGGFHGRTFGAMSVTSSAINYRVGHEPLLPSVYLTTFPAAYRGFGGDEAAAVDGAISDLRMLTSTAIPPSEVGSILIEAVQGEGGYNPAPPAFLRELRSFCDEHGILLIADEVQCGIGRSGRMWGFEHAGIVPDVVVLAKAIANGLPLSAIVSSTALQERWGRGAHGSTYGGNPVACAAGIAVLETIEAEGLVANAAARGAELRAGLERIGAEDDRIGDVRGPGVMIGVEFVRDRSTREPDGTLPDRLIAACADAGLLVLTCGSSHEVVRWIPPLNVTAAEISEGVEIFGEVLGSIPRD
jgi:4-aminobutyrate aminotransferase